MRKKKRQFVANVQFSVPMRIQCPILFPMRIQYAFNAHYRHSMFIIDIQCPMYTLMSNVYINACINVQCAH
uniref:Uncharacterized protein n=1 Tax=Acrobeloides nanus TaxID=290746 RepID=A0A914CSG4_9BILA